MVTIVYRTKADAVTGSHDLGHCDPRHFARISKLWRYCLVRVRVLAAVLHASVDLRAHLCGHSSPQSTPPAELTNTRNTILPNGVSFRIGGDGHSKLIGVVLVTLVVIFEIGSIIAAAAPNSKALIAGRAITGLGGAGISSGTLILINSLVPLQSRPKYLGRLVYSAVGLKSCQLNRGRRFYVWTGFNHRAVARRLSNGRELALVFLDQRSSRRRVIDSTYCCHASNSNSRHASKILAGTPHPARSVGLHPHRTRHSLPSPCTTMGRNPISME